MKTKIIKINPNNPESAKIKIAADIIKKGGLVVFPTETVYGLGANGLNKKAIKKIFTAKGRPQDNPLIIHIAEIKQLDSLVLEIPLKAKRLISRYWPGPLTLILKKSRLVSGLVTSGLDTVAVRMPKNKIAIELIKKSKCPIVAPSANISGRPSPTKASHAIDDLFGKVGAIIEGGKTSIGIESTVLDLSGKEPVILRPGMISRKQIQKTIGAVKVCNKTEINQVAKSPGMKYIHYCPKAKVILVMSKSYKKKIEKLLINLNAGVICINRQNKYKADSIFVGSNAKSVAKNLFSAYRKFDKMGKEIIIVEPIGKNHEWEAVKNRLMKSASKIVN